MKESEKAKESKARRRDQIAIAVVIAAMLSSFAALGTVLASVYFTGKQVQEADKQLSINEKGQVIDRYNAAITNLGSRSIEIRLGGIYALQDLMQDTASEQPTVIAVLSAFVRDHTASSAKMHASSAAQPANDIQAALTVISTRNALKDGPTTTVDLDNAHLANAILSRADLANADLSGADLRGADLQDAVTSGADLDGADLAGANLIGAYLNAAHLRGADLRGAHLRDATPIDADFSGADLRGADLLGADLRGANLARADLTGTNLIGANLTGANLTGAFRPRGEAVPAGWQRDSSSGLLKQAST